MHLGNKLKLITLDASRKNLGREVKSLAPRRHKIVLQKGKNNKKENSIETKTKAS